MASTHPRNTGPMMSSRRCGAMTRNGTACQSPAVAGKSRCRMHGGAEGSGAPKGNNNALKHVLRSADAKEMRQLIRDLQRRTKEIIDDLSPAQLSAGPISVHACLLPRMRRNCQATRPRPTPMKMPRPSATRSATSPVRPT